MDSKAVLHIVATLTRMIGEKNMVEDMDNIGWRGIESHPVEFFRGYLAEFDDDSIDGKLKIDLVVADMKNIARNYHLDIDGDDIIDLVSR